MKSKINPATVGLFVLGALLLFVVGFLSFGGSNIFKKPARFMVYFDESVSGLDPGAPIKFYGVRVGRVAAVSARYDASSRKALVQTVCEINRSVVSDSEGKEIDLTNATELQTFIDRGLRAKLNFTGITGLLFVELSIEDPREYPANPRFMTEALPVVPAIASPISEVQQSLVEIVADIKQVDFAGLSKQVKTLLDTTNQKVASFDAKGLGDKVGNAADAVTAFVNAPETRQTFLNLNAALADLRVLLARIDGNVGPISEDLKKTLLEAQAALKSLESTAGTTQQWIKDQSHLSDEVTTTLRNVAATANALESLANALERNPNSLIVGKKKPEKP